MVHLEFYQPENFSEVNYALDEVQSLYTATAQHALERIKGRNDGLAFSICIFQENRIVGFFVLDFGSDKYDLSLNENSVLLRSLSINPIFQGKGIGKLAMIEVDSFLQSNFPKCNEIVLAVNEKNISAYELYLKTGYRYDGKTRMGRSGLQYLMYKKL